MVSYNEFTVVPESGIICFKEGTIIRVYFDIEPYQPTAEENAPEGMQWENNPNLYVCQNVDVLGRTYGDIVSAIVNDRYSADEVQALQANFIEAKDPESQLTDEKREEYLTEYSTFQAWRKKAKEIANTVLEILSE